MSKCVFRNADELSLIPNTHVVEGHNLFLLFELCHGIYVCAHMLSSSIAVCYCLLTHLMGAGRAYHFTKLADQKAPKISPSMSHPSISVLHDHA